MSIKDDLGKRMKTYESVTKQFLMRRNPVIIRLDGKAFHTFTKGMKRPFDEILAKAMEETAKYLCENIQGCKLAYTQSDEISLLLTDYESINTSAWFDNNVQKMISISASMATLAFNANFNKLVDSKITMPASIDFMSEENQEKYRHKYNTYHSKKFKAMFDIRVFSIPKEEVVNYFIWRQKDAMRNSVQMVAQANFSHKELHKKSIEDIKKMLLDKQVDYDNYPIHLQRGICIVKESYTVGNNEKLAVRTRWTADLSIPEFTADRNYINYTSLK